MEQNLDDLKEKAALRQKGAQFLREKGAKELAEFVGLQRPWEVRSHAQ